MPASKYSIHEIFGPTIQGEATLAGTPCIFIRMSGCNMWDGRPETRGASQCPFCDTDFYSHSILTREQIREQVRSLDPHSTIGWVWISGGEPMLQLEIDLLRELHEDGYLVGVETNGTLAKNPGFLERIDHLVVSPKVSFDQLGITRAHTLKLLYPHPNPLIRPENFLGFRSVLKYLQPVWDDDPVRRQANLEECLQYLYENPGWRMSVQTHKYINVP